MFRPYWPLSGRISLKKHRGDINPLNAELNPICHLLVLLGAHHILHVSRIRVNTGYQAQQLLGATKCIHYLLTHFMEQSRMAYFDLIGRCQVAYV
jgi:hypothetical protein